VLVETKVHLQAQTLLFSCFHRLTATRHALAIKAAGKLEAKMKVINAFKLKHYGLKMMSSRGELDIHQLQRKIFTRFDSGSYYFHLAF